MSYSVEKQGYDASRNWPFNASIFLILNIFSQKFVVLAVLLYGQTIQDPVHVFLPNFAVTAKRTDRLTTSKFSGVIDVLDGPETYDTDDWTGEHNHFNPFKDWTTIRDAVVSTEIKSYSQLPLSTDRRFTLFVK